MEEKSREKRLHEIYVLAQSKLAGFNICHICLEELPSNVFHLHNEKKQAKPK